MKLISGGFFLTRACFFSACLLSGLSLPVVADEVEQLLDLSLKDLLHTEVTSAARREQSLLSAPAAIYVISQQDMRRKGVTNVAEALRGVPGIQVAAIDGNKWMISSRGFSARFANKLLVQIDGRSVYTPSYSGVYWDMQDLLIDNIDRIEVIRGPGATLWGANAVNGIINIITKKAADTQGLLVEAGAGNQTEAMFNLRQGGQLSDNTFARAYLKGQEMGSNTRLNSQQSSNDSWNRVSSGFRIDSTRDSHNSLTLQGDIYYSELDQSYGTLFQPDFPFVSTDVEDEATASGANILGRWENQNSDGTISTLQAYWDFAKREELYLGQEHHTIDLDFQQQKSLDERQQLVWGVGYRHLESDYQNSFNVMIEDQSLDLFSVFIQDEIVITPDELYLTIGSKVEHNDFTGWEIQPSLRMMWMASPGHSYWGSISRAVRTPSAVEDSGRVMSFLLIPPEVPAPTLIPLVGNSNVGSESLIAYELGYRFHGSNKYSLDTTLFYNDYDDVVSYEFGIPDSVIENKLQGYTYGAELALNWQVNAWWKVSGSYSYLQVNLDAENDSTDLLSINSL